MPTKRWHINHLLGNDLVGTECPPYFWAEMSARPERSEGSESAGEAGICSALQVRRRIKKM
ncbi:MAG: hypothetical protein H7203_08250 [Rhizobacter sp.]|nr:hypothetical protein [Burkholderiales bacterium]